ncbi:MAG: microcin C ABC transporter permease YejB [Alphaproteobacteria bacterium]
MFAYVIRRLLLIIPTLLGIMIVNFAIIQVAPGGPIQQIIAEVTGTGVDATGRISGATGSETGQTGAQSGTAAGAAESQYRGAQGLPPEFIAQLERQFGFDKPWYERFVLMIGNYITFDFGESYFRGRPIADLIIERLPVSISIGLWAALISYAVCIPLGVSKARRDGTRFDVWTSGVIIGLYAIPSFLFAILLVVLFAGGRYFDWFPLGHLVSDNWREMSTLELIVDYFWHMTLPIVALVIGSFAVLTMLTKNSFLEELNKQYVLTARAKGLTSRQVLYGHVFRNAMILIIAGVPGAILGVLFAGSLFIEIIFSLDGIGLLGYESVINRDYPVIFATLYFFTLIGLVVNVISDLTYHFVDPRIDFASREV